MKNKLERFWHYWTDKIHLSDHKETRSYPTSGDGHSFRDSYETEEIITPIYGTRLGTLVTGVITTALFAGLGLLIYTGIKDKRLQERSYEENKSLTTKVYSKAWGDDYILNEEETRQLIRDLKIPYPEEKPLSYAKKSKWKHYFPNGSYREFDHITTHTLELELHPTTKGANWEISNIFLKENERGEITHEALKNYINKNQ
ncbi:MAG: hypothetical protein Q7S56_01670 [Nanoarchaeota archaeon]|nr:hypothetical protein [Nanoarchaeota archaeon]